MQLEILERNFTHVSNEYKTFALEKSECRQCSIYDCYSNDPLQSEGNALNPRFMFIGECAGQEESEQTRPFIGRAGQRLREELRKYSKTFNKETCLISNVLCCRPLNNKFPKDGEGPWTISPSKKKKTVNKAKDVVNVCVNSWLKREITITRPKVIVTLGAVALQYIRTDLGITNNRGSWKFLPEYQAWSLATYHPSYILRCENDAAKNHVVTEFEQDIEKVAKTWATIVESDERMQMAPEEWKTRRTLECAADVGLIEKMLVLKSLN